MHSCEIIGETGPSTHNYYTWHSVPIPQIILPVIPFTPNPQCLLCPPIMAPFSRYYSLECRRSRAVRCSWDFPHSRQRSVVIAGTRRPPLSSKTSMFLIVNLCLSVGSQGLSKCCSGSSHRVCYRVQYMHMMKTYYLLFFHGHLRTTKCGPPRWLISLYERSPPLPKEQLCCMRPLGRSFNLAHHNCPSSIGLFLFLTNRLYNCEYNINKP